MDIKKGPVLHSAWLDFENKDQVGAVHANCRYICGSKADARQADIATAAAAATAKGLISVAVPLPVLFVVERGPVSTFREDHIVSDKMPGFIIISYGGPSVIGTKEFF